MRVLSTYSSPNFATNVIPVEFAILHYTACDLERTMQIFSDPATKVCAHFVLDIDGTVFDLGGFLTGDVRQGAHAGDSRLDLNGQHYVALNKLSVGIEIVNLNGNVMPYTEAQYVSLAELLRALAIRFPLLNQPGHITGHEQIAGFRGKCDPGIKFNWDRVLGDLGLPVLPMHRATVYSKDDEEFAADFLKQKPKPSAIEWSQLSAALEQRIKERRA